MSATKSRAPETRVIRCPLICSSVNIRESYANSAISLSTIISKGPSSFGRHPPNVGECGRRHRPLHRTTWNRRSRRARQPIKDAVQEAITIITTGDHDRGARSRYHISRWPQSSPHRFGRPWTTELTCETLGVALGASAARRHRVPAQVRNPFGVHPLSQIRRRKTVFWP